MNRLQKKCFIAAAGMHLLLAVILVVGPAFLSSHSKMDDTQVIDFVPANLIDKAFTGGGERNPTPPAATPLQPVAPQPTPQPPQQRAVEPVKPTPTPVVKETVKVPTKPDPDSLEVKPAKPKISTKIVTRNSANAQTSKDQNTAKQKQQLAAANSARNLRQELSPSTTVETPQGFGGGGEAYAGYEIAVRSAYENAWIPPSNMSSENATAKITVTIGSDGTVISSTISQSSGDAQIDASIQRALDHVKYIGPFPKGSKDSQRTYIIPMNLKTKQLAA